MGQLLSSTIGSLRVYKVKLTFPYPTWDLLRQTPDGLGIWGDYRFYVNENIEECDYWVVFNFLLHDQETVRCSPKNTILLTGEASSIQSYDDNFTDQFEYVITCQRRIRHKKVTYFLQGHPWHIGRQQFQHENKTFSKSYSELKALNPPKKTKRISIILSNVQLTEGHVKRFEFAKALKAHFGDAIDWYGRGVNEIGDKWDGLVDYQYSIALENFVELDWITEKIYDCFLAYTFPIYYGSPNIQKYFHENSVIRIDIDDLELSIREIERVLDDKFYYERNLPFLIESRDRYLNQYNIFPLLANFIEANAIDAANRRKNLVLKSVSRTSLIKIIGAELFKIKRRLKILIDRVC